MTREEEIKDKLETYQAKYIHWQSGRQLDSAEDDIEYLLARNEELQRRVEKMEMALVAIKEEAAAFASDERDIGYIFIGIYTLATNVLDAKEQDNASNDS